MALSFMDINVPLTSDSGFYSEALTESNEKIFDSHLSDVPILNWRQRLMVKKMSEVKLSDVANSVSCSTTNEEPIIVTSSTFTQDIDAFPDVLDEISLQSTSSINSDSVLYSIIFDNQSTITNAYINTGGSISNRSNSSNSSNSSSNSNSCSSSTQSTLSTCSATSWDTGSERMIITENHPGFHAPRAFKRKSVTKSEEQLLQKVAITERDLATINSDQFLKVCNTYPGMEATILKDIRRRSKNKMAARDCRKRRMEIHDSLIEHVKELELKTILLKKRLEHLTTVRDKLKATS